MIIRRRQMLAAASAGAGAFLLSPIARRFTPAAQAAPPKRFVLFWHANGAPKSGDFAFMGPAMEAKGGINILRVSYPGTGDHKFGMPYSTTGSTDNPPKKISIDQAIARAGGKPALVLTGKAKPQNYRGWCSFSDSGATVLPVESPRAAFSTVFGTDPGGGGAAPTVVGDLATSRSSSLTDHGPELERAILDRAMKDVQEVRKRVPAAELEKMDSQLRALQTMSSNLGPITAPGTMGEPVAAGGCGDKAKLAAAYKEPAGGFSFAERIRLHIELIVASFVCDLRRVATLMVTPGGHDSMDFAFLGVAGADPHNTIAHKIYDDAANVERMRKIKVWEMEQLAYLLKRLGETPDPGGGTLLDHTVVLATTECRDGNHGTGPIPVATAGAGKAIAATSYPEILSACARTAGGTF